MANDRGGGEEDRVKAGYGNDFVVSRCDDVVSVLYQDDDILLINKPSGLLSLSGKNPLNLDSVHYRLVHGQEGVTEAFPGAILPHRLDLGTSGVMVVGLHAEAGRDLNKQFQERVVKKAYVAVLDGWLSDDEGQIIASVAKDKVLFPRVKICELTGKEAITEYRVLRRLDEPKRSLVKFTPITGRTHQLRIHSWWMGHPIIGCDLYKNAVSQVMAERLLLHACDLYFRHPGDGRRFHGHSPCVFEE